MLYSIRTTIGQEKLVAEGLEKKAKRAQVPIHAIIAIDGMRGYIFIEAQSKTDVEKIAQKAPHIRGIVKGEVKPGELEHFFEMKTITAGIERGDVVEMTSGAFKGEKAKVLRVDEGKEKVTVEIIEAAVPIPLTVDASSVRVIQKKTT
jgi:transcriptional antiterminator NusG